MPTTEVRALPGITPERWSAIPADSGGGSAEPCGLADRLATGDRE